MWSAPITWGMSNKCAHRPVIVILLGILLAGCSGAAPSVQPPPSMEPSMAPATSPPPEADPTAGRFLSVVAQARSGRVGVYRSRSASEPFVRLTNPTEVGAPLVFLVSAEVVGDWVKVLLLIRPNGSQGWLRTGDVELLEHRFRVEVDLGAHRITVTNGPKTVLKAPPVGVGTQDTPTPGGLFYIKELLRPSHSCIRMHNRDIKKLVPLLPLGTPVKIVA